MSDNKILWYITNRGLEIIEEAITDPDKTVTLSKVKFGDGNGEYYVIDPNNVPTSLKNPWYTGSVLNKYKDSTDTTNRTIVFNTEIPSGVTTVGTVREVGLYCTETINNTTVDTLFAIATCEPLKIPSSSDNYVISVSYDICIKFSDLMSIYDRIFIEAESGYITEEELRTLNKDFLYVESNLMNQISGNSSVIGADLGEQLSKIIDTTLYNCGNMITSLNFTSFCNFASMQNIMGYWVFKYTENNATDSFINDLSSGRNFYTLGDSTGTVDSTMYLSSPCNALGSGYAGLLPYLDISDDNYFYAGYDTAIKLTDTDGDIPFVLSFVIANNDDESECIYLAKSDYYTTYVNSSSQTLTPHLFEIGKNASNEIVVKFFTDINNYVTFTGGLSATEVNKFSSICIRYNGDKTNPVVTIIIDGSPISVTKTSTGTYNGMPNQILDYSTVTPTEVKLPLTSYIVNSSNIRDKKINSKVALISLMKYASATPITDDNLKAMSLNYMAMSGRNVCYYLI